MNSHDLLCAFVGGVVVLALSFGADLVWLWFGSSPGERAKRKADRTKAKWERKWEKRRGRTAFGPS